jgi:hypothetical protein
LVVVGFAGGATAEIPANRLLLKNTSALGVYWANIESTIPRSWRRRSKKIFNLYSAGVIKPLVRDVFPLEHADRALAAIGARETAILMGAIVINLERLLARSSRRSARCSPGVIRSFTPWGWVSVATLSNAHERLRTMDCRFTAPVYPGDAIACEFWRTELDWIFRASVADRAVAIAGFSQTAGRRDRP